MAMSKNFSSESPLAPGTLRWKLGERFPAHELHGDEVPAVYFFDRVHVHDVGMVEGSNRLCLSLEAAPALLTLGELGRQDLERYLAVELGVVGKIDFTHSTWPIFSRIL